jgi:ABC-type uncharacterized transport system permease subunit
LESRENLADFFRLTEIRDRVGNGIVIPQAKQWRQLLLVAMALVVPILGGVAWGMISKLLSSPRSDVAASSAVNSRGS